MAEDIKFCTGYRTDRGMCNMSPRRRGLCDPCYQRWYKDEHPEKHKQYELNKKENREKRKLERAQALADKEGYITGTPEFEAFVSDALSPPKREFDPSKRVECNTIGCTSRRWAAGRCHTCFACIRYGRLVEPVHLAEDVLERHALWSESGVKMVEDWHDTWSASKGTLPPPPHYIKDACMMISGYMALTETLPPGQLEGNPTPEDEVRYWKGTKEFNTTPVVFDA